MVSSCAEEVDQIGRAMKRVGHDPAVCERERREQLSVDFGEQDGVRRRGRAVELRQPRDPLLIGGGAKAKGHAPFGRDGPTRLSSEARQSVTVGGSAKVVHSRLREGGVEVGGNHGLYFQ